MDALLEGDVYLDFPYESAKFRREQATGKVFRRFYGQQEKEIAPSSDLFHQALAAGTMITRDDYFRG